jgi:hypothetical protein
VSKYGHWKTFGDLDPEKASGFVYIIIDKDTNRKYIGKKNFRGRGATNKGVESNWKTYTSSSKFLNELIKEKGKDRFRFAILEQYYTSGGVTFGEVWTQIVCEVPTNNEEFMNRYIDKITFKVTEPITARHRKRLSYYRSKYAFVQ